MNSNDFRSLRLFGPLLKALKEFNFLQMTPIQEASIPVILAGKDLIGHSKTGSGKTGAFLIPILQRINLRQIQPQALILCPTRELCEQVAKEARKFSRYFQGLQIVSLSGGQAYAYQEGVLRKGAQLIIGTPGRTLELLKKNALKNKSLKILVLDEADRLLDESFAEELKGIVEFLPPQRQTIFFSATFPKGIDDLSKLYQKKAIRITIASDENDPTQGEPLIEQFLYYAEKPEKIATLLRILKTHLPASLDKSTLIFCRTKALVTELGQILTENKINNAVLHADLKQSERDATTVQFREGQIQVLVATDVAARGLDIDHLELVINMDLPSSPEIYVHRIGRTGRAGRKGYAVSIATEYETSLVAEIENFTGIKMKSMSHHEQK